jgi:hypothetical protein
MGMVCVLPNRNWAKGGMSSHHRASEEKTEIPNRSRPNPEMIPEEIPKAGKADPDHRRDLVGISACKSFRFRDHKKNFTF